MTDRWRLIDGKLLCDMKADPGQQVSVADKHPDVVERLRDAYEAWWADVSKRFNEYCEIPIGADPAPEVRICCHDWHGPGVPWNQGFIRQGMKSNGFWAVKVDSPGTYEFALRRWPIEVDAPINAAIPNGKAIAASKARLLIGKTDSSRPVGKEDKAAVFRVELQAGSTRMQTWFSDDEQGEPRGAYYVYVKRL